mmetsp:Transcript_17870/g.37334  ORF Transcript_17870/g.37334 Transcript_17870/m.37334 type:complete len:467 (-) Transcript_17870:5-1405(-)
MISSSSEIAENFIDGKSVAHIDDTMPWGIYIPPSKVSTTTNLHEANSGEIDNVRAANVLNSTPHVKQHTGYVRVIDSKGKSFPCGFTRPVGVIIETVMCSKRSRSQMSGQSEVSNGEKEYAIDISGERCDRDIPSNFDEGKENQQKKTITETHLHPEEALFLHLRGQFQVMRECRHQSISATVDRKNGSPMNTQDLFCKMLLECKIPLAAFLAYAHLRAQGYNLIRYTKDRMGLLYSMQQFEHKSKRKHFLSMEKTIAGSVCDEGSSFATKQSSTALDDTIIGSIDTPADNSIDVGAMHEDKESVEDEDFTKNDCDDIMSQNTSTQKLGFRELIHKYSEDVSTAPPPCVISLEKWNRCEEGVKNRELELSYYAYNPNFRFRRSNPGLPDFGVAVMPFKFDDGQGPSFDILASLVSLCESSGVEKAESEMRGIPLRVLTIADGGSVIAFGVTRGDVPDISNQSRQIV